MVTSRRDPNDNVIALSPFRAELGRGRRLRRADALYEARDLGAAVRALPGDELYYVLHEVGLQEGADLLAAATPEQLQIVLDFALWERDQIGDQSLAEWLDAISAAPVDRIGRWLAGLDSELVGLVLRRRARIYDLSQEEPPDEPEGTLFPTPDGLFVLDVLDAGSGDEPEGRASMIRLMDALYRSDKDLARRILVGARSELDAELEESAYRWRQARMADLGFADYYEALEVYRELDPAAVRIGDGPDAPPVRPTGPAGSGEALRVPTALAERLRDTGGSPFARAAQKLGDGQVVEELRFALVTLTNRVLAADRVAPGDDEAVTATLERLAATLDLAIERLSGGDDARGAQALRKVPLTRLFRLGFSLTARVRRLALALRREGPLGPRGFALAEPEDATVLETVTRSRPLFPRLLDQPAAAGDRPFRSLADLARATAAVERAAAAQAMLRGLGVTAADLAPDGPALASTADPAAIDLGLIARTVLVRGLLTPLPGDGGSAFRPLDPADVKGFEAHLNGKNDGPPRLPAAMEQQARARLDAATPAPLASAGKEIADRWLRGLAPLEPVLVGPGPRPKRRAR